MEIVLAHALPPALSKARPLETYETKFLYVGFSRFNTEKKRLEQFHRSESGTLTFRSNPLSASIFPRCYHTELARVTVYSQTPLVWTEEVSPADIQIFIQAQHVA